MIFWIEPGIHLNPVQRFNFILTNGLFFQVWYLIIFVAFSCCLLILVRGIGKWLEADQTTGYHLSTVFGFIWASYIFCCGLIAIFTIEYLLTLPAEQQSPVWYVIYAIQMGLGDGVEWVGGIWLAVSSWFLLRSQRRPLLLHKFGLLVGSIGCLTLVPALSDAGAVFGLAQIIWFAWVATVMLKQAHASASLAEETATR